MCSEWLAFPQPPFSAGLSKEEAEERRAELGLSPSILLFPNPVQFTVNEVVFAVSNNDILKHVGAEEIYRPA